MSAKTIGAFALGFACGMLTLSIVIRRPAMQVQPVEAEAHRMMPDPAPPPPAGPPPNVPEPPRSSSPARLHLAMPIAGVKPADLADTFRDSRNGRSHEALDIAAPRGTPVKAVAEGNVAKLFTSKQGGLTVYQFDNTQTYAFYYAHLDRYAPGLKEGALLRAGDVLGFVGTTGNAPKDTPHLHFAVFELGPEKKWWEGKPLDPLPLLR